jgi:hypothetical protein
VKIVAFPVEEQAESYLRKELRCMSIVGVMGSIPDGYHRSGYQVHEEETKCIADIKLSGLSKIRRSIPLDEATFATGNICFALSKERQGLPLPIGRLCDLLVHIPHLPLCGDFPLLNTPSCLSITLDKFTNTTRYKERMIQGHKFDVVRHPSNAVTPATEIRLERASAKDTAAEFLDDDVPWDFVLRNDQQSDDHGAEPEFS